MTILSDIFFLLLLIYIYTYSYIAALGGGGVRHFDGCFMSMRAILPM